MHVDKVGVVCRHNIIVLGIRLDKCNSGYQLAAGGPCSANVWFSYQVQHGRN
jgi:hypothetical protein